MQRANRDLFTDNAFGYHDEHDPHGSDKLTEEDVKKWKDAVDERMDEWNTICADTKAKNEEASKERAKKAEKAAKKEAEKE